MFQSNILPRHTTAKAYVTVFKHIQPSFPSLFANSLFIATVVVICHLVFASLAGYAFARLKFESDPPVVQRFSSVEPAQLPHQIHLFCDLVDGDAADLILRLVDRVLRGETTYWPA